MLELFPSNIYHFANQLKLQFFNQRKAIFGHPSGPAARKQKFSLH
jgi:hypothetical protein